MPSSKNYKRDYKQEYANYQGKPDQIAKRSERNKARRIVAAFHDGKIHGDVDHKKPIAKGGGNSPSNLHVVSPHKNRSFSRTKHARMK